MVEDSNALDHTSPIEEKRQPFVIPIIGLLSASDATIMGDPLRERQHFQQQQ
jgi:hypothetical protein